MAEVAVHIALISDALRRFDDAGRSEGARHSSSRFALTVSCAEALTPEGEIDADLAVRARSGDSKAFEALVGRYAGRIYSHQYRMVKNREEAEDLTQETFLRAYRFLDRFDVSRPFKNWLYTIATNVGLNALRTRRRRGLEQTADERTVLAFPVDDGRLAVAQSDLQDTLTQAVEQLPAQSALLVHLHYHEGLSISEAAEIIGMSEGAAKVALHRARKRLREILVETRNAGL